MGIKVRGLTQTVSRFKLRRKSVRDRMGAEMLDAADELKTVAELMAPRKSGTLESSIEVDESFTNSATRLQLSVSVDEGAVNDKGRKLQYYAGIQHENLAPYGGLNLGEVSREKNDSTPWLVGGGFMTRARQEVEPDMASKMRKALSKGLSGLFS